MNLDQALQTFIVESRELLEDMENALLTIEQADEKKELINAIFRAAHTIKGSSGLFNLDHVVAFTHVAESVLDRVRDGKIVIADQLVVVLLSCCDHIGALIDAVADGQTEPNPELTAQGEPLLAQLRSYLDSAATNQRGATPSTGTDPRTTQRMAELAQHPDCWYLSIRFGPEVLRNGMDPLSFIRFLGTLGKIVDLLVIPDALPDAAAMDPEVCYLGYEIALETTADKLTIENAFEFVRDDCQLRILPPLSQASEYIRLIQESPEISGRLGEMMVRCGTITPQELTAALHIQADSSPPEPIGSILVQQNVVRPEVVDAALQKQKQAKEQHATNQENRSIRIDAEKLDQLINLVGELIIVGAGVNLIARRAHIPELQESTSKLSTLVEEVRDSALQLRMVKIGATFNRFQRVVHDVSRELGKDIQLLINGEETELDKTVVEKIGDPLMHLVRNSMDHGIEAAAVRLAAGKPAQGTLKLDAYHDSGCIVISVEDDGGGLKRDRILAKAIERGLVEAGHQFTDSEVYALIFEPGFSTAEKISNLSGRGVGLDVVKRNITALRGSVSIQSQAGLGTSVTVRLPLTLAIIDGFLVGIDKSVFAIPLDMIEECVTFSCEPGQHYTNLRGEVLPFIRLRELFSFKPTDRRENIVVIKHAGQKAGLVVDSLLGEFQTVIKPLGKLFNQAQCVSGSTILGSGEVALILDVPSLVQKAIQTTTINSNLATT